MNLPPVSSVPPVSEVDPPPVTVPVKVAPTMYSREEAAVVSGATGSWLSSLAETVSFQPSGVVTTPGSAEATRPLSGGGPASTAGSAGGGGGGSADARGANATGANIKTAAKVAKRFNMRKLVPLIGFESEGSAS